MRRQHEIIIEALENAGIKFFTKRVGSLKLEYISKYSRRIFYHETPIITVLENMIILRHGGWKTTSTSQNLRGLVENIFNIEVLYNWKGVKDEEGLVYNRENDEIEIYGISKSTYRTNLQNLY